MSRSLLIGLIVTLGIITGLATYFYITFVKVKHQSAIEAIPVDAAIILDIAHTQQTWERFAQTNLWNDLRKNEAVSVLNQFIQAADSLASTNEDLQTLLSDNRAAISFHSNRGHKLSMLVVLELGKYKDGEGLLKWMAEVSKMKLVKRYFDKETLYDLVDIQQHALLSMAIRDQLLLISTDGTLVEEGIRKMKYHLQPSGKGFEQAKNMSEASDLNVYVNYQELPLFMAMFNKPEYKDVHHYISAFANWSILNVSIEKERLGISGMTYTDDSLFQFLDLFKTQSPIDIDLSSNMPVSTAYALQLSFSNFQQFGSDLNEYLQNTGKLDAYLKYADSLEERYRISITDKLGQQLGATALIGIHEGAGDDFRKQVYALIQMKNAQQAKDLLVSYTRAVESRAEADTSISYHNGQEIFRLPLGNIFKVFYGHPFEHLQAPFFVFRGDFVLFANDLGTMHILLDEINSGRTLAADPNFQKHRTFNPPSSNVNVFLSPAKSFQLPGIFANDEFISVLNRYAYDFKKFEYVNIQYASSTTGSFITNVNVHFNADSEESTKVLWSAHLDTTFQMQPVIVYNSELKQRCILVQDVMNTVYFVSNNGTILWKTQLSGKINSNVFEVDPYRTGEIHYLFSTNKQACLINHQGLNVMGYPVRFPGTATAGINLFDPYGDSTWQFYVPLENNRIMGYLINGKPVPGWNPRTIGARITTKLSMVTLGTEPYLCGTGSNYQLMVLGLKSTAFKQTIFPVASPKYPAYVFSTDTSQATIWYTDSSGLFTTCTIKSNLDITVSGTVTGMPQAIYHLVVPTSSGYALLSAGSTGFELMDQQGTKLQSVTYVDSLATLPMLSTSVKGIQMIGYTLPGTQEVHWKDWKGAVYPSLPVRGVTPFVTGDVLSNNTQTLVVGDDQHNLILYRLK